MEYNGHFPIFDSSRIRTYPLRRRENKMDLQWLLDCEAVAAMPLQGQNPELDAVADYLIQARDEGWPVILQAGAHPVKSGLTPLFADLIRRGYLTLFATNTAAIIHNFELALTGASSERVPLTLPLGEFGMAFETGAYLNEMIREADRRAIGLGEGFVHLLFDAEFRRTVLDNAFARFPSSEEYLKPYDGFPYAEKTVFAAAHEAGIPVTIHAMIGTDIIDQHGNFDGAAKGSTSARDFLIYAEHITRFGRGGAVLNVASAVLGPEVLLKAASMAANCGKPMNAPLTATFDIRPAMPEGAASDESQFHYYFRDQKTVASRLPGSFGGTGYYFQGDFMQTFVELYKRVRLLERERHHIDDSA